MTTTTRIVALICSATVLSLAATPAMAKSWAAHHPRQAQVLARTHHQVARINDERRDGEITGEQARALRADSRDIAQDMRADAKANGGYITKDQQRQYNRQLNAQSRVIGH